MVESSWRRGIAESLLEPDSERSVAIPIENVSCESVCLESGVVFGRIEPVTIVTEPETAVKQITREEEPESVFSRVTGDPSPEPTSSTSRNSKLLESIHVEESLSTDHAKQMQDLVLEVLDVLPWSCMN